MHKSKLFKEVLHHDVVTVRVNPEVSALLESPVDAERTDAFFTPVTGYPMHDAVGAVVQPSAFGDIPVGRFDIRPLDEEKSPDYLPAAIVWDPIDSGCRAPPCTFAQNCKSPSFGKSHARLHA